MKVISTNIAEPKIIIYNGQEVTTGIFKKPVETPIFLEKENVRGDEVSDRRVHGGEFKACYLFSADYYPYWKNLYPNLDWDFGMLGENLTISGLDESNITIGSIYKIGNALVQVTQPREPCFKFGVKFVNPDVLKQFIEHRHPGFYVKVLVEGHVKKGDKITLVEQAENSITISEFYGLLFDKIKNQKHLKLAINNETLPERKRVKLMAFLKP
ncbi:MOSC domain-containing protein [Yeosuana sp. MJ-SS3]|jgi:MOSC domain-containing protein YiiM|uniref:MOSC domain-containing protein n=1 Tax=Gilvirhabdus luticola TaxID=3079858 RepID=A0ABU3U579_9FLAO|nr:MOSC domain-containing protein [Yeosuana sp. MJ-SS3]MDU8885563.1 MOSC domain-containing protein [Yeosuana sp. MJ-SS3]